jgi:hypothetical protein
MVAVREQEQEADRERIRLVLEKAQEDLKKAATDLEQANDERRRALSERSRLQSEVMESQELLRDAAATRAALESDLRKQRESQQRARAVQTALDTEIRVRQETEKALRAAGTAAAKAHKYLVDAEAACALERQRVADANRTLEDANTRLTQQATSLVQQSAQLALVERRLEEMTELEQQLAGAERRAATLERELANVTEVASTVGAVQLDREELEVRLEMAAVGVRIARKEADRYRAEAEEKTKELVQRRQEASQFRSALKEQEGALARAKKAEEALSPVQNELGQLKATVDQQSVEIRRLISRAASAERSIEEQQAIHETLELELCQLRAQRHGYEQQSLELVEVRTQLDAVRQKHHDQVESAANYERLAKELHAARRQLLFQKEQTEELERLRELVQRTRDQQQGSLEAERRLLTAQAELERVKWDLESANRRLEDMSAAQTNQGAGRHDSLHSKTMADELTTERTTVRELRGRLGVAEGQLLDLERLRADNRALREESGLLRQHQDASRMLEQLQSAHRKLRLEWELSARRVEELTAEREELVALRSDAEQQRHLDQEVKELRRHERILYAQIYGLGQTPQTQVSDAPREVAMTGTRAAEIEADIASLLSLGQRTVVLADHQGFPVASGGESSPQDGLAAFTALVGDVARRAETLLPLGSVQWVQVVDRNRTQVSCRLFQCGPEAFTLATLGQSAVDPNAMDGVVVQVATKMKGQE